MHQRVFVDQQGTTRFEPLDTSALPGPFGATVVFGSQPVGGVQDWHNAQCPMYIITLSGEMDVEIEGGHTRRFGPGDVRLAEDTTGPGHVSRVVGNQPWHFAVLMLES